MALTDTHVRNAKPREKTYKIADERGLFLVITPNSIKKPKGSKSWRFKYRFFGKEKTLSIGMYPDVSLIEARDMRDRARKLLKQDIDPSTYKKLSKNAIKLALENTFESVAVEWHAKQCTTVSEGHKKEL